MMNSNLLGMDFRLRLAGRYFQQSVHQQMLMLPDLILVQKTHYKRELEQHNIHGEWSP